jgi:nucleoside-diphosphate-sugar epimerase
LGGEGRDLGVGTVKVLLTGNSGLVGRAVADRLEQTGHEVVGLSRRGGPSSLAADLRAPGLADQLARQPRCGAIVHAAAAIAAPPGELALTNCFGTQQMLELAERWEVASFVFISSLPVIGQPRRLPITEDHPVDPPTPYHASKVYGEHLGRLATRSGIPVVSLRLTAPVGAGMSEKRILSAFVRRAAAAEALEVAGQGSRSQDYVDVRDVAAAVTACLERRPTGVLNIASGHAISNLELARLCVQTLGSASPVRLSGQPDPEEGLRWEVSIQRAAARIGYRPRYSLAETIGEVGARITAHA